MYGSNKVSFVILLIGVSSTLGAIHKPKNPVELTTALRTAKAGDVIHLLPTVYKGDFILPAKDGVTLDGKPDAKSKVTAELSGTHTVLDIQGGKWTLQNLKISGGSTSIQIEGNGHTLRSITLAGVQQGVVISGNANIIQTLNVQNSKGLGIGLDIVGDQNSLTNVHLRGTRTGIQLEGDNNKLHTINIEKGELGAVLNGTGNAVNGLIIKGVTVTGVIIGVNSQKTSVTTANIQGPRNGIIIADGSRDGTYNGLTIRDGLLQLSGDSNTLTTVSSNVGANIFGCKNTLRAPILEKLFQSQKNCNTITGGSVKHNENSAISTGRGN